MYGIINQHTCGTFNEMVQNTLFVLLISSVSREISGSEVIIFYILNPAERDIDHAHKCLNANNC